MSLIQLASLQKIVVALADHLLFGILGNQQSARIQLGTAFFHQAQVVLANHAIGRLRVSVTPFASQDPLKAGGGAALAQALEKGGNRQSALVSQTWLLSTGSETNAFGQFKKLNRELLECRNGRAFTMVSAASKPMVTRVLPRGNWQDESGEVVQPTAPHFLPQIPNPKGRRLTRLDTELLRVRTESRYQPEVLQNGRA